MTDTDEKKVEKLNTDNVNTDSVNIDNNHIDNINIPIECKMLMNKNKFWNDIHMKCYTCNRVIGDVPVKWAKIELQLEKDGKNRSNTQQWNKLIMDMLFLDKMCCRTAVLSYVRSCRDE
jgi:DNA-directed RNA polymerase subunit N (RpoN/RPB10)